MCCALKSLIISRNNVYDHHFYFSEVNIQVQNDHGVLSRLISRLKCMELGCQVLHGHFGHLLQLLKRIMLKNVASENTLDL